MTLCATVEVVCEEVEISTPRPEHQPRRRERLGSPRRTGEAGRRVRGGRALSRRKATAYLASIGTVAERRRERRRSARIGPARRARHEGKRPLGWRGKDGRRSTDAGGLYKEESAFGRTGPW
jgi:hypothetical protein